MGGVGGVVVLNLAASSLYFSRVGADGRNFDYSVNEDFASF